MYVRSSKSLLSRWKAIQESNAFLLDTSFGIFAWVALLLFGLSGEPKFSVFGVFLLQRENDEKDACIFEESFHWQGYLLFPWDWAWSWFTLCFLPKLCFHTFVRVKAYRDFLMGISVKMQHQGQATSLPRLLSALWDHWLKPPHCHCWCHQHQSKVSYAEITLIYLLGHTCKQYSRKSLSPHMLGCKSTLSGKIHLYFGWKQIPPTSVASTEVLLLLMLSKVLNCNVIVAS